MVSFGRGRCLQSCVVTKIPGHQRARELMSASAEELWSAFRKADQFGQMGDRGDVREERLTRFLQDQLPTRFAVASGEVIDSAGNQSGQTDILVFDCVNTRPLITSGDVAMLPAEAVLASVEVKTKLTKGETDKAVGGMVKMRAARPWDAPWAAARHEGAGADDKVPRLFSTIFAYDTDLIPSTWASSEMQRLRSCATAANLPVEHIDRVVILSRGMLLPGPGTAYQPTSPGRVLGSWFFQLVSFLAREVTRREAFPWDRYKFHERDSWSKVAEPLRDAPAPQRATARARVRARRDRYRLADE